MTTSRSVVEGKKRRRRKGCTNKAYDGAHKRDFAFLQHLLPRECVCACSCSSSVSVLLTSRRAEVAAKKAPLYFVSDPDPVTVYRSNHQQPYYCTTAADGHSRSFTKLPSRPSSSESLSLSAVYLTLSMFSVTFGGRMCSKLESPTCTVVGAVQQDI